VAESEALAADPAAPPASTNGVIEALTSLGYEVAVLSLLPGRSADWLDRLISGGFSIAFNLCESVFGRSDTEHLAAAAVELLQLPVTGARSSTLLYCLDKDRCAATLRAHGVPVPDWRRVPAGDPLPIDWQRFPAIAKPAAQDASNGIHPYSVATGQAELSAAIERLRQSWGDIVVQEFIDGREINLAIVGNCLLPPAEIDFSGLPEDAPSIVSFAAKWQTGSPEDLGTQPVCPAPLPDDLTRDLQQLAARAWCLMDGCGYGRVDIRLAAADAPYVIDINPNPDLSPDAGLARQAAVAGWSYEDLIARIVDDALRVPPHGVPGRDGAWVAVPPAPQTGVTN
jgi:D-alanine-D-alanine ligase